MPGTVPDLTPAAQAYIRALETRLEKAEQSLRLLPQQKGPLPGWLRAGTIEAGTIIGSIIQAALLEGPQPVAGPFATLDLTGSVPGSSPLLRVNDGTRDRFDAGNLAAYTDPNGIVSAADYGQRTIAGDGTLVSDSQGVPGIVKILGSVQNVSQASVTGNGSWQTVSGTTINFSVPANRNIPVVTLGAMTLLDPTVGDTGFNLEGTILVDGAQSNSNGPIYAPGQAVFATTYFAVNVFSGSHSVALGVNQTNTHLWTATLCYLYVFQFGK